MHWYQLHIGAAECAAADSDFSCPFSLYGGSQPLQQSQKLAPDDGLVGPLMVQAFMASAFTALALSLILLIDKVFYHRTRSNAVSDGAKHNHRLDQLSRSKHYMKAVHLIETTLHTLSDQQLALSAALLVALDAQECQVSAYHFNLVCSLLLLSVVVHLNTLANTHDFILKGKSVAFARIASIIVQIIVSAIVLSARISQGFPTNAGRLSIMPAACFENANATSGLGFGTFVDIAANVTSNGTSSGMANSTQLASNFNTYVSSANGAGQYVVLVIAAIVVLVLLGVDACETLQAPTGGYFRYASIISGALIFIVTLAITALTVNQYNTLSSAMQVPDLYQVANQKATASVSQILPWSVFASLVFPITKAISESLEGSSSRRFKQGLEDVKLAHSGLKTFEREIPDDM